jgi:GDP-L-fucose synthase
MSIFITGGGGFLGTELRRQLKALDKQVVSPTSRECDLTISGSLEHYSSHAFETIYHLAAWTQAGDFCLRHPGEQWIINQKMNTNVLEWWQTRQPQAKLVFIGTSCAYAPGSHLVEGDYMRGEPIESLYTYAMTKRMLFAGAKALEKQFGLKWYCVVPSTLYGPGYHTDGRQMHFIFDLIRKIIRGKEFDEPVTLWGDGHQKREVVFVGDFVSSALKLVASHSNDIVNIGAGEEFSIRTFASVIAEIVGFDPERIEYDTTRYVGATSKCLSIDKLKSIQPNFQPIPLRDGLRTTIEWFYQSKAYLASS